MGLGLQAGVSRCLAPSVDYALLRVARGLGYKRGSPECLALGGGAGVVYVDSVMMCMFGK